MRRIIFIATVVAFTQAVSGFSQLTPQTPATTTTLRRIQVNAKTITALPKGKKYVVDLTKRGVRYEFNPTTSRIDFSRVMVRTAQGEVPIESFLKKVSFKDAITGFKYTSQSFTIGTRAATPALTPSSDRRPPTITTTATANFECDATLCSCKGTADCSDLILNTTLCGGAIVCGKDPKTGAPFCFCDRIYQ